MASAHSAIVNAGGVCQLWCGDVTAEADINSWIADIITRHGWLAILVNNVSQSERIVPESVDNTVWQQQMDLNFNSVMMACPRPPQMIEQGGGVIVNISIAGIRYLGKPQIAYSAASRLAAIHQNICGDWHQTTSG